MVAGLGTAGIDAGKNGFSSRPFTISGRLRLDFSSSKARIDLQNFYRIEGGRLVSV